MISEWKLPTFFLTGRKIKLVIPDYEISEDSNYLFACAELKAREKEFVERHHIERLIGLKSVDKFIKAIQETYYGSYAGKIEETGSFDMIMLSELTKMASFLKKRILPEHRVVSRILTIEEDLHNIKLIIKSKFLNKDFKNLFIPFLYSYDKLNKIIETRRYDEIDFLTSKILQYSFKLLEVEKDFRILEFKMESFYLQELFDEIILTKRKMLKDLIRRIIDIFNIENICRYKYTKSKFNLSSLLYKNGFLDSDFLNKTINVNIKDLVKLFKDTPYKKMVEKGIHFLFEDNSFSSFEISKDFFYLRFFDSIRYSISNLEKIIEFFYRKKIELKTINIIFMGILYNIERDKIKSRVALLDESKAGSYW